MLRKFLYQLGLFFLFGVLWIILNEKVSVITFMSGGILGILAVMLTENVLTYSNYRNTYNVNIFEMLKYLFYLLFEIYYSGFSAVKMILSGDVNPDIVTIETEIEDDFKKCILANSITLTPGTVTLDVEGKRLKVLWINCLTKDGKVAGEKIKGKLERKLLKG
jgi:multicomponent Na+:H+ antiporter subunit E